MPTPLDPSSLTLSLERITMECGILILFLSTSVNTPERGKQEPFDVRDNISIKILYKLRRDSKRILFLLDPIFEGSMKIY